MLRAVGDRSFTAVALHNLGQVALVRGDVSQALNYQHEGLGLAVAVLNYRLIARMMEGVAEIALVRNQSLQAVRLVGASAELRRTHGVVLQPTELDGRVTLIDQARQVLGPAYVDALDNGRLMTLQESVQLALSVD